MKLHTLIFLFVFSLAVSLSAFADCGTMPACVGDPGEVPGDTSTPGANCCDDVTVPFDGGVSLLIAAGLGIGARSAYKKKKKVTE